MSLNTNNKRRRPRSTKRQDPLLLALRGLSKGIHDLKVDTQVRGSPRIADPPRIFLKNRKSFTLNQTFTAGSISVPTANTFFAGVANFTLSSCPLGSALALVFDAYKFQQVTVRFVPTLTPFSSGSGGLSPLLTVIDYDDSTALVSYVAAQSYDTCQETPFGQYVERTLYPRIATAAYAGGILSGFTQARDFVDCNSNTVNWYGVKYVCAGIPVAENNVYTIEVDAVITLISVR
jgi:hypothetical protein